MSCIISISSRVQPSLPLSRKVTRDLPMILLDKKKKKKPRNKKKISTRRPTRFPAKTNPPKNQRIRLHASREEISKRIQAHFSLRQPLIFENYMNRLAKNDECGSSS